MAEEPQAAASPTLAEKNEMWGEGWADVRAMWPLPPTVAYLDHGSYGAVSQLVLEEQQSWRDRMETNPLRFFARELPAALDQARSEVAHFFGTDGDAVAWVKNVTSGINTVLSCFPLAPGDELLITDHAYGAVGIAAHRWASAAGAEVVTVHVPLMADDSEVVAAVNAAVTPRTRLAVLDEVASATARRFPVATMVADLQERQVAVLVDGAHAAGMLDVQLDRLGADFYTASLHKWACAPRGAALLYAAKPWRARTRPLVASWDEPHGFPQAFNDTGTDDVSAWLAAPRALRSLEHLGLTRLRRHNSDLAAAGQRAVAASLELDIHGLPASEDVSMRLIPLPQDVAASRSAAAALQAHVSDHGGVEVGVTTWRGHGFLRVSAHAYNAPSDYDRFAQALPSLLEALDPAARPPRRAADH